MKLQFAFLSDRFVRTRQCRVVPVNGRPGQDRGDLPFYSDESELVVERLLQHVPDRS